MARPRYSAAKRARELKQKAKRDAKLARKHARKSELARDDQPVAGEPGGAAVADTAPAEGQ